MRKSKRESTACHEAGHAVATWSLGLKIRKATIVPADDHLELVVHDSPLRGMSSSMGASTGAERKANNAVMTYLAGPAAQRKFRPRSRRSQHGQADYDCATVLALWLNDGDAEMATAYLEWMRLRAERIITNDWRFVVAVADKLLRENVLDRSAIVDAIGVEKRAIVVEEQLRRDANEQALRARKSGATLTWGVSSQAHSFRHCACSWAFGSEA